VQCKTLLVEVFTGVGCKLLDVGHMLQENNDAAKPRAGVPNLGYMYP